MEERSARRDIWLFYAGAVFGAGHHTREELLGRIVVDDAPSDVCTLLQALVEQQRIPVLGWLKDRKVEAGNGADIFEAIAQAVSRDGDMDFIDKKFMELNCARKLHETPQQIADRMDEISRAIRERNALTPDQ